MAACLVCGKEFKRSPCQVARGIKKYCSVACFGVYHRVKREPKPCLNCGKLFINNRHPKSTYCSQLCAGRGDLPVGTVVQLLHSGKYLRNWIKTDKGVWVRLSHYLLGIEKIEDGYVIHHKDGNPTNDTIENLELMDRAQHAYIHSGTLRQYWDNLKEQNLDRQSNNTGK